MGVTDKEEVREAEEAIKDEGNEGLTMMKSPRKQCVSGDPVVRLGSLPWILLHRCMAQVCPWMPGKGT